MVTPPAKAWVMLAEVWLHDPSKVCEIVWSPCTVVRRAAVRTQSPSKSSTWDEPPPWSMVIEASICAQAPVKS
jgi:hypothetical protein